MEFISTEKSLPEVGQTVIVKFNRHRYGLIHSSGEAESEYIGLNTVINKPMFDIGQDDDECYYEVTEWRYK